MRLFTKIPTPLLAAFSIALSLAACNRERTDTEAVVSPPPATTAIAPPPMAGTSPGPATLAAPMTTMPPAASTAAAPGSALNSADQAFLAEVTSANEEEIATTELGMDRGNAKNKALARMLQEDHVALRGKVAALMPNAPPPPAGKAPADLGGLDGAAFDTKLLEVLREQHESAIRKFTDASVNPALSESVRTLAKQTLPTLQSHLKAVQDAQGG